MVNCINTLVVYVLILCFYLYVKNENTFKQHVRITNAINSYLHDCIDKEKGVDYFMYSRMRSYDSTLWRLWDWGYTNILPPEDFELIKNYIKK